jgi:hypothetical protein
MRANRNEAMTTELIDPSRIAAEIKSHHQACLGAGNDALQHAKEAGDLLADLKRRKVVPHGQWSEWVQQACGFSVRSAQRYMQIAENWPKIQEAAKAPRVAFFPLRDASALIAKPKEEKPYAAHGTGTKARQKAGTTAAGGGLDTRQGSDAPSEGPSRENPSVEIPPAAAPAPAKAVTAADLLPVVSKLHADLRKVTENTNGEAFDGKAASLHTGVLADLLTGETPKYRLAKAGDVASQAAEIFDAYPDHRKVGRDKALVAIRNALKRVTFDELLAAVQEFAKSPAGNNGQYTPHPATWFGEGRWTDARSAWQLAGNGRAGTAPRRPGPGERFDPTAELGSL